MKINFLSVVCLGFATGSLLAKPPAALQHRLDEWSKGQPGGVAAAWVDADGTTFAQSGRFADEASPAITPDTQFELGSITKVFTALLLAESERLGKVSRNDPAAKYLLPSTDRDQAALAKITLLALTTHTSGLPSLPSNIGTDENPYASYDRAMLVDALRTDGVTARVGRHVAYSNFGVAVLGEALAAAWGMSYAEVLRARVLAPLGLKATTVGLTGLPPPPDFPRGHAQGRVVPQWTFQAHAPAGALRSSARDMARFLEACLGRNAGGSLRAAFDATIQPQHRAADIGGRIGLGWFITDEGVVWHNGITAGSHALVAFDPKAGTGVVVLANVQRPVEPLGFGLLGAKPPQPEVEVVKDASAYVGRYPLSPAFAIDVTERNGTLQVQATGQPAFALRSAAADRFALVGVAAEVSFARNAEGRVIALILHQNGRDQRAPRGELPAPPKEVTLPVETLREYAGDYPLAPTFVITITETGGALFAQATGQGKVPVFASAKDEFFYKVVAARISFQRDGAGKVTGLVLHQNGRDMPASKKVP
ncbi:MAG TPA: serine hydrolase [Lacunisphaera sp.]|nr:serine hydrolase [Lacunisphaera sp.]